MFFLKKWMLYSNKYVLLYCCTATHANNMKIINLNLFLVILLLIILFTSCVFRDTGKDKVDAGMDVNIQKSDSSSVKGAVLVTDDELNAYTLNNERIDRIFEDFLFFYISDPGLQVERTVFPLRVFNTDNSETEINPSLLNSEFIFMTGDYITKIHSSSSKSENCEPENCSSATLQKINLLNSQITNYNFAKKNEEWRLISVSKKSVSESDLNRFLTFYAHFTQNEEFRYKSLKPSIQVSMMEPDDESQTIEGFISRDQFLTMCNDIPSGTITNIRYNQTYSATTNITLEKIGIGNGMKEMFHFSIINNRWQLSGYEN